MEYEVLSANKEKYHEAYMSLQQYCFKGIPGEQLQREWTDLTPEEGIVLGSVESEKIAASVTIFHHPMSFYGQKVNMGGIGLVATSPYYREGGYCRRLIQEAIAYMDQQNILFSALGPFSYSFYEQFGYKQAYQFHTYNLKISEVSHFRNSGYFKPGEEDQKAIESLYGDLCKKYNGLSMRTRNMWTYKWRNRDLHKMVYHNKQKEAEGYIFYRIIDGSFRIEEIHYTTLEALQSILAFVAKHRAQVGQLSIKAIYPIPIMDLLHNPYGDVKIEPFMMARIINVEKVLKCYPFTQDGEIVLKVQDDTYPVNTNTYAISINDGKIAVEKSSTKAIHMEASIQALTQLLMGFRTVDELCQIGQLKVYQDISDYFKHSRKTGLYDYF